MSGRSSRVVGIIIVVSAAVHATAVYAQKYQAGFQISGMHLHKIDAAPVLIGGRFDVKLNRWVAAAIELNHSWQDFGATTALAGLCTGGTFRRLRILVDARSGWMHFEGPGFETKMDRRTHMLFESAGTIEYYVTSRAAIRLGGGDAVIYYGGAHFYDRPHPDALGTVHNFKPSVGFAWRF